MKEFVCGDLVTLDWDVANGKPSFYHGLHRDEWCAEDTVPGDELFVFLGSAIIEGFTRGEDPREDAKLLFRERIVYLEKFYLRSA